MGVQIRTIISENIARRCDGCREIVDGTPWRVNADVPGPELTARWPLPAEGRQLLDDHLCAGRITRRGLELGPYAKGP